MSNLMQSFHRRVGHHCVHVSPWNFDYSINISISNNYIFVETPKAGCSTIKSALQRAELTDPDFIRDDFRDIHNRDFSPLLCPKQLGNLDQFVSRMKPFIFCFVRNPYSRILSAYLDKIVRGDQQKRGILLHLGLDPSAIDQDVSFKDFLKVVSEQSISVMDPHWKVQYYQTLQSTFEYDFVGKVESFDRDFLEVLSAVGIDGMRYYSREMRHSTGSDRVMREYYDNEAISTVRDKFSIDFEEFDYEVKPWWNESEEHLA